MSATEKALSRARAILSRGGWLERQAGGTTYAVRAGGDRRARVLTTLDEAGFEALVRDPGLKVRTGGGWMRRSGAMDADAPGHAVGQAGAPGRILGERSTVQPDGRLTAHSANLGQSPIGWLAARRGPDGRPWLSPAEAAAAERLRADAEIALSGPSLTMRWDALPRAGGGSAARVEPGDRALAAGRRVARALEAVEPRLRAFVDQVCVRETSLQLAEREAGFARREGKAMLKAGLRALAAHYGMM